MKQLEPANYIKEMLGVDEGSIVDTGIDIALGSAPVIGKALTTFKIKRLEKRMKINENQLLKLKNKIESSENELLYKEEVFPLIINKLMEDDEDEKAKVIIDGFENVIDKDIAEIERVYHYYDVLSELRYSDIVLFVKKYMPIDFRKIDRLNFKLNLDDKMDNAERLKYEELKVLEKYQINKFIRLGLIIDQMLSESEDGNLYIDANKTYKSRYTISDFGQRFLEFFSLNENES